VGCRKQPPFTCSSSGVSASSKTSVSNAIDWLKWVAIVAMFADHIKYAGAQFDWLIYPGRIAFPIFAVLCGWNAANYSRSIFRYSFRILLLGLVMEGVQYASHYAFGTIVRTTLNPVLTLGLGVFICAVYRYRTAWGHLVLLAVLAPAEFLFDYGASGVLLIVLTFSMSPNVFPLILIAAALLNPLPTLGLISCAAAFAASCLLRVGIKYPCMLPNGKLLYLSFPLSFVPPIAIKLLFPG